jgi:hypothetical protein
MTRRSWQRRVPAATRTSSSSDDFRHCAAIVRLISVRIRCTASTPKICTGETCRSSLARETSAAPEDGIVRGDNRCELRTAAHHRRPVTSGRAAPRDGARRARRSDVPHARRRARASTALRIRRFSNRADQRSASRARHEARHVAPARLPALRLAALVPTRNLSALRQASGGGGCR